MVPLASVHTTCLMTRCEFFWLIVCSDWCLCVCLRLRVLCDPSSSLSLPKPCHLWPFGYRRFSTSWETWTLSDQPICSQTPCSYPTRVSPKVPFKGGSPVKFSDLTLNPWCQDPWPLPLKVFASVLFEQEVFYPCWPIESRLNLFLATLNLGTRFLLRGVVCHTPLFQCNLAQILH